MLVFQQLFTFFKGCCSVVLLLCYCFWLITLATFTTLSPGKMPVIVTGLYFPWIIVSAIFSHSPNARFIWTLKLRNMSELFYHCTTTTGQDQAHLHWQHLPLCHQAKMPVIVTYPYFLWHILCHYPSYSATGSRIQTLQLRILSQLLCPCATTTDPLTNAIFTTLLPGKMPVIVLSMDLFIRYFLSHSASERWFWTLKLKIISKLFYLCTITTGQDQAHLHWQHLPLCHQAKMPVKVTYPYFLWRILCHYPSYSDNGSRI